MFKTNLTIEEPFYHQMAYMLNGRSIYETINGRMSYEVTCPRCKKRKARMFLSKQKDTFMFGCPVDGCKWGCNLNDLINTYGSDPIQQKWISARTQDDWFPIKNRIYRGKSKKSSAASSQNPIKGMSSDLDKMQIRGALERHIGSSQG